MKKSRKKGAGFWNDEYKNAGHLALSTNPSEDLEIFTRFLERESGRKFLNPIASVLDLGCGNGRNLIYLAGNFGMRGVGYDISREAIAQAKKLSAEYNLQYEVRSIAELIPLPDASQTVVLDMMTSHVLNEALRTQLYSEVARVLKPGGWFFFKTFLLDEDKNAMQMLRENPAGEKNTYIHPVIGVAEHVFTEDEIRDLLEPNFTIHKIHKSHRHLVDGKRRSIMIYAEKA